MISISHSDLLQALSSHADTTPDKTALISDERRISYKNLWNGILSTAALLRERGIGKGDRVLLGSRKDIEFVYLYFASHLIGAVNVVTDIATTSDKLRHISDMTSPKIMFGLKPIEGIDLIDVSDLNESNPSSLKIEYGINSKDTADIMFTTGTTSLPKGVCLSHSNIAGSASNINAFIGNVTEDVEVLGLPLSHSFGLGRLRCTLLKGATLVLVGNFANLKIFFQSIERYDATGFAIVPAAWEYIIKLSGERIAKYSDNIRYIEIGSAAMPKSEKERLLRLFPTTRICMHYGSTEASRSMFMEFHEYKNNLDSIGRPATENVEALVANESGSPLSDGNVGEICVKGNMVMLGYLRKEDNENAFYGDFFRTGDYGRRDEDGNFYLLGRGKEIINIGGKKVSPASIEEAIKSLGIADCVCVPMKDPKGVLGEVPKAFIQKTGCKLDFNSIRKGLVGLLEPFEIPVEFEWIDRVPRTSTGKIQRVSLMN